MSAFIATLCIALFCCISSSSATSQCQPSALLVPLPRNVLEFGNGCSCNETELEKLEGKCKVVMYLIYIKQTVYNIAIILLIYYIVTKNIYILFFKRINFFLFISVRINVCQSHHFCFRKCLFTFSLNLFHFKC